MRKLNLKNKTLAPAYLALYQSGELRKRVERLEARLASCDICPRECGVNRLADERKFCHSGRLPIVSSFCAHHGEEPPLSGSRGSGTVFFANCNMRCVYCQNHQISQDPEGQKYNEVDCQSLARQMLRLQEMGCHNINLVSPSHFVPQIMRALLEAVSRGLQLPLVYNSSGYDSLKTVRELDGVVDIYLPDLRYASNEYAGKYSQAPDYRERSREAIQEMFRQVGELVTDEAGVARRGVIVRHLVLPNGIAGSEDSLAWLAQEVSPSVAVSIMSQYYPSHRAYQFPELARPLTTGEYEEVVKLVEELGLENGWLQGLAAERHYRPDFRRESHPFEG